MATVIMSGDDSNTAVKNWLESKVDKFLYKPLSNEVIKAVIQNAIDEFTTNFLEEDIIERPSQNQKEIGLVGISSNIRRICTLTMKYSKSKEPVLVVGETGTGKELVAKEIHENSNNSSGPFIAINCAAITKSLFESELFGHVKGAFTDAKEDKLGKFREASNGTLFLDEVHHLNRDQQASLLKVLEEKKVMPVGGKQHYDLNLKLVVASKSDLRERSVEGSFMPDLYFRIAGMNLIILPLRERPEDIIPIINFLQKDIEKESGNIKQIMRSALHKLASYDWPGNVRELKSDLQRLNVVIDKSIIKESDLSNHILEQKTFSFYKAENDKLISMKELETIQRKQEITLIIKALKQSNNKVSDACKLLDMKRTTLSSKMENYGLRGKDTSVLDIILGMLNAGKTPSEDGIDYEVT